MTAAPEDGGIFGTLGDEDQAERELRARASLACPDARRAAFDRWKRDGQPWPPPEGLTNAIAGALLAKRR